MAIINSVLIGKGHGKVGNVVLSNLKGQTILKSLNSSPSNPKSTDQVAQRSKMAYSVKMWQFVYLFMANFKSYIKPLESGYNAFIRNAIKVITTPAVFNFKDIWPALVLAMDLKSNMNLSFITNVEENKMTINLIKNDFVWNPSFFCEVLLYSTTKNTISVVSHSVTEAQYIAGTFVVNFPESDAYDVYCYCSSPATKQNTNIISTLS